MLNLLEKEAISNTFAAVTSFEAELNQMLLSIIQEKELPLNSLHLYARSIDHVKGGNVKVHLHIRARIPSGKR